MYKVMDPNADSPKTPPLNLVEYKELQETNASQDEAFAALSFLIEENNSELQSNIEELSQKHDNDIEELSQKHDEDINELSEDINALKDTIDNDVQEKLNVIETDLDNTMEHLASTMSDLTGLEDRVAELPTVSLVNEKIQTETACFRGYFIDWDDVPDDDSEYKNDPYSNKEPNNNDYMVVGDYNNDGCWRFKYTGDWKLQGKDGWEPEYKVSDKPLTQDQIAVLDSGITSIWKENIENDIDELKNNIDELEEDLSNTIAESNAALIMKHDNDINNAEDMIKSQKIKSYKEYYAITQNATAPIPGIPGTMHTVEWNFQNAATDLESIQYTTGNVIGNDSNYCLEVDAINGKFEQRSTDAQFNAGTIIRVPIGGSSSSIKVVSYPGFYHFTIGGIAANSNVTNHICSLDEIKQGFVEIVATDTAYLYSIESTFVEIGFIENSIIPTELYPYLWHYTEIELMNGELFKTNVTLIGTNLKHGSAIVEIDNALDKESTNPVQNKVVTEAIDMITLKNTKIIRTQAEFEAWQNYVRNDGNDKTYEHVFIEAGVDYTITGDINLTIIGTKTIDSNGAEIFLGSSISDNEDKRLIYYTQPQSKKDRNYYIKNISIHKEHNEYLIDSDTGSLTVFYNCPNISNCNVEITKARIKEIYAFAMCSNISNCNVEIKEYLPPKNIAVAVVAFIMCSNISNCNVEMMAIETEKQYAFYDCLNISNCNVTIKKPRHSMITSRVYAFYDCSNISNCNVDIELYVNYIKSVSAIGFNECNNLSRCMAAIRLAEMDKLRTVRYGHYYNAIAFCFCNNIAHCYGISFLDMHYITEEDIDRQLGLNTSYTGDFGLRRTSIVQNYPNIGNYFNRKGVPYCTFCLCDNVDSCAGVYLSDNFTRDTDYDAYECIAAFALCGGIRNCKSQYMNVREVNVLCAKVGINTIDKEINTSFMHCYGNNPADEIPYSPNGSYTSYGNSSDAIVCINT